LSAYQLIMLKWVTGSSRDSSVLKDSRNMRDSVEKLSFVTNKELAKDFRCCRTEFLTHFSISQTTKSVNLRTYNVFYLSLTFTSEPYISWLLTFLKKEFSSAYLTIKFFRWLHC